MLLLLLPLPVSYLDARPMRGRALCFGHFSGHTRVPLTHTHTDIQRERTHARRQELLRHRRIYAHRNNPRHKHWQIRLRFVQTWLKRIGNKMAKLAGQSITEGRITQACRRGKRGMGYGKQQQPVGRNSCTMSRVDRKGRRLFWHVGAFVSIKS